METKQAPQVDFVVMQGGFSPQSTRAIDYTKSLYDDPDWVVQPLWVCDNRMDWWSEHLIRQGFAVA